jgi:hypothetical protein
MAKIRVHVTTHYYNEDFNSFMRQSAVAEVDSNEVRYKIGRIRVQAQRAAVYIGWPYDGVIESMNEDFDRALNEIIALEDKTLSSWL